MVQLHIVTPTRRKAALCLQTILTAALLAMSSVSRVAIAEAADAPVVATGDTWEAVDALTPFRLLPATGVSSGVAEPATGDVWGSQVEPAALFREVAPGHPEE